MKKAKKDETIHLSADLPNGMDKDKLTLEIGAMKRTMAAIDTTSMSVFVPASTSAGSRARDGPVRL